MQKLLKKNWKKLQIEIKKHKLIYSLLFILLLVGTFIRVYRTGQILGFYFDQGRDAMAIWNLWHKGDFFLIGPTTGIAGIFRGPFYYYLITPFYILGNGNPVVPANFLAILSMVAVVLIYYLGTIMHSRAAGLFAAILAGFSYYIMVASRWLSNPTPMLLLSLLLIWMMVLVSQGKKWAWVAIAFLSGSSLFHFGSSGEFFYFPALGIFFLWQFRYKQNRPTVRIFLASVFAFFVTLAPLVLFDILHEGLLFKNIKAFLFEKESFQTDFWVVVRERFNFYYDVFTTKIFHWRRQRELILLSIVGLSFLAFIPRFFKNTSIRIVMLMLISPIVGLLFFQGNEGNIYDYYMTGYYLIFILLFGLVLGELWKYKIGKLFVAFFFFAFIQVNAEVNRYKIIAGVDGPETIMFGNQKQALDWIYTDAGGKEFSVDVYVPPVIPHAYDYLFAWYGGNVKGYAPATEQIDPLYTLYEVDPPHPERLKAWLDRQAGIGEVEKQAQFGGITVQKRKRI